MKTKYLTLVSTAFNPFTPPGKVARSFLSMLPPDARQKMKVDVNVRPRTNMDDTFLHLSFKDQKEIKLDLSKVRIKDIAEEVERHSRKLARQEELAG